MIQIAIMENLRFKNANDISEKEDNFEILKCSVTGTVDYGDIQWTLICDKSGSMHGDKAQCLNYTILKMLCYFIEDATKKNNTHYIHLISFDHNVSEMNMVVNKDSGVDDLEPHINNILRPDGMTDIGAALSKFGRTTYDKDVSMHNVILMTDGEVTKGIKNHTILKEYFEQKLKTTIHGTPAVIGYGVGHDIDCMEKLASVPNAEYHCIESTEGAGFVYGEVMHSCLNEYCRNTELIIRNGQVYDFKANIWVDKLYIGRVLFDKPRTWSVRRNKLDTPITAILRGENVKGEKKEMDIQILKEPIEGEVNDEVERCKLRYLTQRLLAESRHILETPVEPIHLPPPPSIQRFANIPNLPRLRAIGRDSSAPPPMKRQCAWNLRSSQSQNAVVTPTPSDNNSSDSNPMSTSGEDATSVTSNDSDVKNQPQTARDVMIDKLEKHLKMLKEYIKVKGDDEGYVSVLCDDTYVAICSLQSSNGRHFVVARQVTQGNQRAYMASDISDMIEDDTQNYRSISAPQHQMMRSKTTPYASQQVASMIRAVSDNV